VPAKAECHLESLESCRQVLDAYDAATDRLVFSTRGRFWESIQHARELGKRGAGRKIAIIDSACDMSNPRLKRVIDYVAEHLVPPSVGTPNTEHGTAVALLISEVAPDSRIDIYPVVREDGKPDIYAVRDAIIAAAESDAHVLNLSLGLLRHLDKSVFKDLDSAQTLAKPSEADILPKDWLASKQPDDPSCVLCPAAAGAAAKGKLVFAAAGNASDFVYCPARSPSVVGVGFQSTETLQVKTADGIGMDAAFQVFPSRQSMWFDSVVDEIDGVLGTSFASPLRAAAAALFGLTPQQYAQYFDCIRVAVEAMVPHNELERHQGPIPAGTVEEIAEAYRSALRRLPHVHCRVTAGLRPELPLTDPSECATCGHFFGDLYINAGLFCLEQRNLKAAEDLLEAARKLTPWSGEAAANLGATYRLQLRFIDARTQYDDALDLRPGTPSYINARETVRGEIEQQSAAAQQLQSSAQSVLSVRPDPLLSQFSSGSWAQVSASARSREEFSQKLAGVIKGWEIRWETDKVIACKQQVNDPKLAVAPGQSASAAGTPNLFCVSCDGQTITSSGQPRTTQALLEVADVMAAIAGLLKWNMVKVKGEDEFLRMYQMCQMRRAFDVKK